jgi:uncharacterized membrane protein YdjX (TVP38/TMEM64 family)
MSATPHPEPSLLRRIPRHLLLRFAVLVLLVGAALATVRFTPLNQYLTIEKLSQLLEQLRGEWWAPLALMASFVVLCPLGVPASPMLIAGGIVFGAVWGTVYNIIGTYLGGVLTYFLGRVLGRDFFVHLVGKRLKPVERAIARRGFWSFVGVRFLPIPYPLVNYCAAFVGIRPGFFLITTAIGLIPSLTIFTYFAATLARLGSGDKTKTILQFGFAILLIVSLAIGPQIWMGLKRKRRYRELVERRKGRGTANA